MAASPAPRLAFVAGPTKAARTAKAALEKRYDGVSPAEADIIVALGGDGLMLQTLHRNLRRRTPIFGMNLGTVGFLMNTYRAAGLPARLRKARHVSLTPLRMVATNDRGKTPRGHRHQRGLAAALQPPDRAHRRDGRRHDAPCRPLLRRRAGRHAGRLDRLQSLGAWPDPAAGRRPAGADADQRLPAAALARRAAAAPFPGRVHDPRGRRSGRSPPRPNSVEIANVVKVVVTEATDIELTLLFDPEHDLEERILKEQFAP